MGKQVLQIDFNIDEGYSSFSLCKIPVIFHNFCDIAWMWVFTLAASSVGVSPGFLFMLLQNLYLSLTVNSSIVVLWHEFCKPRTVPFAVQWLVKNTRANISTNRKCRIQEVLILSVSGWWLLDHLHKVYDWTLHNNLIMNPDKTICTLFTTDSAEYSSNLGLNINNKALPMALYPKVLGLTLDPKLTSRT